jgi:hypothetical protein
VSLHAHNEADGHVKTHVRKKKLHGKKRCRYRQWLWASPGPSAKSFQAHNEADGHPRIQVKGKKIIKKKTIAATGSGCDQVQVHEQWAHMLTFKLSDSSILTWKKLKLSMKIPLPVPAVALSKPKAMRCELTCWKSSWWSAQNSREKIKIKNKNTTAGIGSGFEQAQGHQLWAYNVVFIKMRQFHSLIF